MREAKRKAKELVDYYWPEIERVAQALVERGKLSGEEVKLLVEG
jgi:hypothetical protein